MDKFSLVTDPQSMEKIYNNAVEEGCRYLRNNPAIKSFIIGESGGIDSAVTTAIAAAVVHRISAERDERHKLIAYSLPIVSNKNDELLRAESIGRTYCDHFAEVKMNTLFHIALDDMDHSLFHELNETDAPSVEAKIRAGNIKARMRMMYLYDKANKYKGIVLSTDNYTEFLLGFWTLHGDVGDFGFIQELWKTEVYALAEWIVNNIGGSHALQECIDAKPTDGLGVTNSDLDQLLPGWEGSYRDGYRKVDDLLLGWIQAAGEETMEAAEFQKFNSDNPVIQRHLRTRFKRLNPYNLKKSWLLNL